MRHARKKIKDRRFLWAIMWSDEFTKEEHYSRPPIYGVEVMRRFKVRCHCKFHKGWHWGNSLAILSSRREALAYMESERLKPSAFNIQRLEILAIR